MSSTYTDTTSTDPKSGLSKKDKKKIYFLSDHTTLYSNIHILIISDILYLYCARNTFSDYLSSYSTYLPLLTLLCFTLTFTTLSILFTVEYIFSMMIYGLLFFCIFTFLECFSMPPLLFIILRCLITISLTPCYLFIISNMIYSISSKKLSIISSFFVSFACSILYSCIFGYLIGEYLNWHIYYILIFINTLFCILSLILLYKKYSIPLFQLLYLSYNYSPLISHKSISIGSNVNQEDSSLTDSLIQSSSITEKSDTQKDSQTNTSFSKILLYNYNSFKGNLPDLLKNSTFLFFLIGIVGFIGYIRLLISYFAICYENLFQICSLSCMRSYIPSASFMGILFGIFIFIIFYHKAVKNSYSLNMYSFYTLKQYILHICIYILIILVSFIVSIFYSNLINLWMCLWIQFVLITLSLIDICFMISIILSKSTFLIGFSLSLLIIIIIDFIMLPSLYSSFYQYILNMYTTDSQHQAIIFYLLMMILPLLLSFFTWILFYFIQPKDTSIQRMPSVSTTSYTQMESIHNQTIEHHQD